MLTRLVESGVVFRVTLTLDNFFKLKAHNYLPTKEDPKLQAGEFVIEFISQQQPNEHNHYIVTKINIHKVKQLIFFLSHGKGTEYKEVNHLHYTEWPDHGVPESQSILQLMEVANSLKTPSHPQVVHCRFRFSVLFVSKDFVVLE